MTLIAYVQHSLNSVCFCIVRDRELKPHVKTESDLLAVIVLGEGIIVHLVSLICKVGWTVRKQTPTAYVQH